ncbi:arginine--tRNA ligase [Candidatus Hamiltonella defensa]|uniref:Arginine--tRNA ligase n=1 Tax=Hamiltonella defensa subsp. Acyrthosiphon pisum (strain 5AT) TaxID=572265 RepID=SYR_HAMD5|nr:arginine--tRNA ligase [Candidatus Hamiltonella defensa]C4K487.1 RecName: Full=Arginine--tRNA ligase; AltName: Full=Arginyl-tRNA synthetase; Short=ArgRS [Candidatus Hamiltonella defensa 5AT (Acyrthosiphon pisum)]ACQ67380.1 arginine tRNA synthetase [Candidatus Hamiltonella defensa 5AT (Acyrthosiphon pisum)]
MNIQLFLSDRIRHALIMAGAPDDSDAQLHPSTKAQFGDYQANGVMSAAKKQRIPPRELAERVLEHLDLSDIAKKVEIAGPGFINIFLNEQWISQKIESVFIGPKLGLTPVTPQRIVIDYSAPNVAKEMHVGHLRSTIIGDAMARTLSFLGHHVIRANHIGDWGTQFGMLIAYLEKIQHDHALEMVLSDLEHFYREAKKHYDEDEIFAQRARDYVVKLQSGDPYCREMWRKLVDITMTQNHLSYERLKVTLTPEDMMGESLYNDMLPNIVEDLIAKGVAVKDQGSVLVFLEEYQNKIGEPMGVVIQKKDGGYLYATTDIACVKYRCETLKADRILYYIDSRQNQHLAQVWTITRLAGYVPESVSLEHHMFGMMLGKDGKPFKTRTGGTVKLSDLLDEAVERAGQLIRGKNPDLNETDLNNLIQAVAIGAVKYADLSKNRTTDYIFDWDRMLSFEGNTAPYIQYAYSRVTSLFKKSGLDEKKIMSPVIIQEEKERSLAILLLQFEEMISTVARDGTPHLMCSYLYDLATRFSIFYEHCPILNAKNEQIRQSRLKLAWLTAKTLKLGLKNLGIETVERM